MRKILLKVKDIYYWAGIYKGDACNIGKIYRR